MVPHPSGGDDFSGNIILIVPLDLLAFTKY
jgi:hypothetical protein